MLLQLFCVFINPLPPKRKEGKAVSGGLAWEHSCGLEPRVTRFSGIGKQSCRQREGGGHGDLAAALKSLGLWFGVPREAPKTSRLEAFKNRLKEEFGMMPLGRSLRQPGMGTAPFPAQLLPRAALGVCVCPSSGYT